MFCYSSQTQFLYYGTTGPRKNKTGLKYVVNHFCSVMHSHRHYAFDACSNTQAQQTLAKHILANILPRI